MTGLLTPTILGEAFPAALSSGRTSSPAVMVGGVIDTQAIARQQLPSAVPAPSLIAALQTSLPQPLPKTSARQTPQPSSALAAQLLSQGQLAPTAFDIFQPRALETAEASVPEPDSFLADMRLARGEASPTQSRAAQLPAPETTKAAVNATPPSSERAQAFSSLSNASALPALLMAWVKQPNLLNARGVAAYQLSGQRNALLKKPAAEAT